MMGGFGGCCGWGWFGGLGSFGLIGAIINVVLVLGFALLFLWVVRRIAFSKHGNPSPWIQRGNFSSPREILAARYARGEIDRDEYRRMLEDLQQASKD